MSGHAEGRRAFEVELRRRLAKRLAERLVGVVRAGMDKVL